MALISSLTDNFNDNTQGSIWGNSNATGVATKAETGGMAVFTCATSGTVSYAYYGSSTSYDLTGNSAYLQINNMVNTSTNAQAYFKLYINSTNYVQWVQENNTIRAEKNVSGTTTTVGSNTYDFDTYRWLRIRENAGVLYFDYSVNGRQWLPFISTPNPIATTALYVEFGAGTYQSETNPGFFSVDNFNTPPTAAIDKTYVYKQFTGQEYIGVIDTVVSDFRMRREINTAGTQVEFELAVSFADSNSSLDTEALVDESAGEIVTEGVETIVASSSYTLVGIPSLNDRIEIWEFSSDNPYGRLMFNGLVSKFRASYTNNTVTVTCLSYGVQLDNYIVQILPESVATEHGSGNYDSDDSLSPIWKSARNRKVGVAQTFQVLSETEVQTIYIYINNPGTYQVPVQLYVIQGTPTSPGATVGSVLRYIPTGGYSMVAFQFNVPITLSGTTDYHIALYDKEFSLGSNTIKIGYASGGGYTSGQRYTYNDSTGWSAPSGDLIFQVVTSSGAVGNQFNSYDPSEIVRSLLDSFVALGGNLSYNASSIEDTNTVVSYTFKFNTYYEALQKCVDLAPANWWFTVDPGTGIVSFKSKPTNVTHTMVVGSDLSDLSLEYSLEDLVNVAYLSGGDTGGGTNLLASSSNAQSISLYGKWLETPSDNRVTDEDTANIILESMIGANSEPKFKVDQVIVPSTSYDNTLFDIGELVGFSNANSIIDSLQLQIMSIDYTPDNANLILEVLPPTQSKRVEDIKRNLQKQETENNPDL